MAVSRLFAAVCEASLVAVVSGSAVGKSGPAAPTGDGLQLPVEKILGKRREVRALLRARDAMR